MPQKLKKVLPALILLGCLAVIMAALMALPYRIFVVRTGSMSPTIPSKSAVLVQEHHFRQGQVISFFHHGEVVTHRFVGTNPDGTINTKGDGNTTKDPWTISPKNVIGHAVAAPRGLGYWLVYLRNPIGAASILLTLLCIWQIWAMVAQTDQNEAGLPA